MAIHLLNPRSLYRLADGMHTNGGGLYLRVQKSGQSRTWAFRFQRKGKRVSGLSNQYRSHQGYRKANCSKAEGSLP